MGRLQLAIILFAGALTAPVAEAGLWDALAEGEVSGHFAGELRLFPHSPRYDGQHTFESVSMSLAPEYYLQWGDRRHSLTVAPFFRVDQNDGLRTHGDIRELFWQYYSRHFELKLGVAKVYWGVAESQHLVDVINQTDLVENIDGEDKLGQPMIDLTLILGDFGTLDLFLLVGSRERNFVGSDGRLRGPVVVSRHRQTYQSALASGSIDGALRWAVPLGAFDIGLSYFHGTNREPVFTLAFEADGTQILVPRYRLMHQWGADLQWTYEGLLLKAEAIVRTDSDLSDGFVGAVGGFEYTFAGIFESAAVLGVLVEYNIDSRREDATTLFENDMFAGARLTLNDTQSLEFLGGGSVDLDSGAAFLNVETSRRLGDSWKLALEIRAFLFSERDQPEDILRRDSYAQIELQKFF